MKLMMRKREEIVSLIKNSFDPVFLVWQNVKRKTEKDEAKRDISRSTTYDLLPSFYSDQFCQKCYF